MNKNKFMIASLLILIGMGAIVVSCEKHKPAYRKAKIEVLSDVEKDGGGDDEDPIIQGKVKKRSNHSPVIGASVETINAFTTATVGFKHTDSLGRFEQKVDAGIYYFKIAVPSISVPFITDTIHVYTNRKVELEIELD